MTKKCNIAPYKNSLYHFHDRTSDSRKRDDFNDTGTKKKASNTHKIRKTTGIVLSSAAVVIVSPFRRRLIVRSSQ